MRQYISQKNLDASGLLSIVGKDYRYMRQVLRLKSGDMISVRLPDGNLQNMTVCQVDESAKRILLQVCDVESLPQENQPELNEAEPVELWLFMFVPKSSKMDLIVRQATECGVSKIIPVSSDFSQKGAEKANFRGERFERIIKEARQQSGSPVNTTVEECITVQKMCEMWQNEVKNGAENDYDVCCCVLYERSDFTTTLSKALEGASKLKKCAVVCGAEGGISPEEIKLMLESGIKAVHFKTNILRCETAALYGIAAMQNVVTEKLYGENK